MFAMHLLKSLDALGAIATIESNGVDSNLLTQMPA
jgi:hypothetical protein